ncbi:MAG TPA: hypothetical protein VK742_18155 [Candidatus Sulfotelmatobacter sp.]|jgi:hypothetical protein|nr:hypothetical protein [Candidatus Sulfotelmatobacter sp.]
MRVIIVITLAFITQVVLGEDKIKEIVENGIATRDALNDFTTNAIPGKWRTKVEDQSTNDYTKKVYSRGDLKILEVSWKNEWSGDKSNVYAAVVFDGQKRIGKVIGFSGIAAGISQPRNTRNEYDMITNIKTNGLATVMFSNDNGYFQVIELRGRNTRLLDDFEYTKTEMMLEQVAKPLVETIKDEAKKPAANSK